jgi:hypothetical protein
MLMHKTLFYYELRHPSVRHSSDTSPQVEALEKPRTQNFQTKLRRLT